MISHGTILENYVARYGYRLTASKITEPMVRALYWKRQRWAAEAICERCGWGRLPEWRTWEFEVAYDDLCEARDEHQNIITELWRKRGNRIPFPADGPARMALGRAA